MGKMKTEAMAEMDFLKDIVKVYFTDVFFFLKDFAFHYAVTWAFFSSPSFVLSSSRYLLVALAPQQRCARLPAGGKCFPC